MNNPSPSSPFNPTVGQAFILVLAVFAVLTIPVLCLSKNSNNNGNYNDDGAIYHIPEIRQIHAEWPRLDLRKDALATTAPGYHYLLASISMLTGDSDNALRWLNWFFSSGVLLAVLFFGCSRVPGGINCLLLLPLAASNFYIKSACWVLTDNAALLLAILAMMALSAPVTKMSHIKSGGLVAAATFTRQMYVWLLFPMLFRVFVHREKIDRKQFCFVCAGALIPVLVLLKLYLAWGGLVPKVWGAMYYTVSLCPVAYLLSCFGLFGIFYLPLSKWADIKTCFSDHAVHAGLAIGLIIAVATPTAHNHAEGRWGGYLWDISDHFPVIGNRSLFFTLGATVGGAVIAILWRQMRMIDLRREAALWLSAVFAWACSSVVNRQVYQRYYEPMTLFFCIFALIQICHRRPEKFDRGLAWRLGALWIGQTAITFATVYRAMLG